MLSNLPSDLLYWAALIGCPLSFICLGIFFDAIRRDRRKAAQTREMWIRRFNSAECDSWTAADDGPFVDARRDCR